MKRGFRPDEVIDLTTDENDRKAAKRSRTSPDVTVTGFDRVHSSWNVNNGSTRFWSNLFSGFQNFGGTTFGRGGFNRSQQQGHGGHGLSRDHGHKGLSRDHEGQQQSGDHKSHGLKRDHGGQSLSRGHGGNGLASDHREQGPSTSNLQRSLSNSRSSDNFPPPRSRETNEEFLFPGADVFSHPSQQFRSAVNPDPDSFRRVAEFLTQQIPDNIHTDRKWTRLTESVMREYSRSQQTFPDMEQKIELWKEIYRVIRAEHDCGIFIFGSTFNGFGNKDSDVDMCLFMDRGEFFPAKEKLVAVRKLLRAQWSHNIRGGRDGIMLIPAKVPILKFKDCVGNLDIDLSVDNPTSIRNTHMLYYYSSVDYRVRPLVMAVKTWAKRVGINDASCQTISSYGWTLMVIHFLQFRARPKVLPCLHDMYPNIFNDKSNIFGLDYTDNPGFKSDNDESVGSLLAGFFHYYDREFDFKRDVASIRTGKSLSKDFCEAYARKMKTSPGQWRAHLLLEEPFDRTNAGRAVCNEAQFQIIRDCLKDTNRYLTRKDTTNISLHNLWN